MKKLPIFLSATLAILAIIVVSLLSLSLPKHNLADLILPGLPGFSFLDTPFGGRIEDKINCDTECVADGGYIGTYLKIGSPVGGKFMVTPLTKVYEFYNIQDRNWTLGLANDQERVCKKLNIAKSAAEQRIVCDEKGKGKEIKIMGTTKKP